MARTLRQRRGLLTIEAEILADGVTYRERGPFTSHETKVPFEQIADDLTRVFHVNRLYLAICAFFGFLLVTTGYRFFVVHDVGLGRLVTSTLWFLAPTLGTWMNSAHYVGFVAHPTPLLFFDTRGGSDPMEFLEAVRQAKADCLRDRFGVEEEPVRRRHGFLPDASAETARRSDTTPY